MIVRENQAILGDDETRACPLLSKLAGLLPLGEPSAEKALKELFPKRLRRIVGGTGIARLDGFFHGNKNYCRERLACRACKGV